MPDGIDIFVPIGVVQTDRDHPVAIQHGVTMTPETLQAAAEHIRAAVNNPVNHDDIPRDILGPISESYALTRSPFGKNNLRRVSPIFTIPIRPKSATTPVRERGPLPPPPPRRLTKEPILATVKPPIEPKPQRQASHPAIQPRAEAVQDNRPVLVRVFDAHTEPTFTHAVSQREASAQIQEVIRSIDFASLNLPVKGIEGVTISLSEREGAVLHADLLLGEGRKFGINLSIRTDRAAPTGVRTELKLGFIERQLAKAFAGDKLDMVSQIPDMLLVQLNALLKNVTVRTFEIGDGTFRFVGSKKS